MYEVRGMAALWLVLALVAILLSTLLMSTGLTHGIIDQGQYSPLLAVVIGSAVVPTIIATAYFVPKYPLPRPVPSGKTAPAAAGMGVKGEGAGHPAEGRSRHVVPENSGRIRRVGGFTEGLRFRPGAFRPL